MNEKQMRYKIVNIYVLIDALERELIEFNPLKTLNNNNASLEFQSVLNRITRLRKYMDKNLGEYAESWGDCADDVIELIEKHIKEIELKEAS